MNAPTEAETLEEFLRKRAVLVRAWAEVAEAKARLKAAYEKLDAVCEDQPLLDSSLFRWTCVCTNPKEKELRA